MSDLLGTFCGISKLLFFILLFLAKTLNLLRKQLLQVTSVELRPMVKIDEEHQVDDTHTPIDLSSRCSASPSRHSSTPGTGHLH